VLFCTPAACASVPYSAHRMHCKRHNQLLLLLVNTVTAKEVLHLLVPDSLLAPL
jgi:hypothetical protein